MLLSVFRYLDIFFTIITIILYVTFLFYTSSLNSKFLIFFISSFMNIFCYSSVLKNEYNFFLITLLNIVVILIIVFYYFNIELREDLLPEEFIARNYFRYAVIIGSFLFSLFCLTSVSLSFLKKKDTVISNSKSDMIISKIVKSKSGVVGKINYIDNSIQLYNKKVDFFSDKIFQNYNILIIIYMFFLTIYFFVSKNEENINFFLDEQSAERKIEDLFLQDMMNETETINDETLTKKTSISKKKKKKRRVIKNRVEEDNYSLTNNGNPWWIDDDINEEDAYRMNKRNKNNDLEELNDNNENSIENNNIFNDIDDNDETVFNSEENSSNNYEDDDIMDNLNEDNDNDEDENNENNDNNSNTASNNDKKNSSSNYTNNDNIFFNDSNNNGE